MSEVMESLATDETILNAVRNAGTLAAQAPTMRLSRLLTVDRVARQRTDWCSTLGERDLQCLLQILEADLIPQLLNSYSPARHAPLDRFESPG